MVCRQLITVSRVITKTYSSYMSPVFLCVGVINNNYLTATARIGFSKFSVSYFFIGFANF